LLDDYSEVNTDPLIIYINIKPFFRYNYIWNMILLALLFSISAVVLTAGSQFNKRFEMSRAAEQRFLQNTSHELKTPLMAIQGYAEGIITGIEEPETDRSESGVVMHEQTAVHPYFRQICRRISAALVNHISALEPFARIDVRRFLGRYDESGRIPIVKTKLSDISLNIILSVALIFRRRADHMGFAAAVGADPRVFAERSGSSFIAVKMRPGAGYAVSGALPLRLRGQIESAHGRSGILRTRLDAGDKTVGCAQRVPAYVFHRSHRRIGTEGKFGRINPAHQLVLTLRNLEKSGEKIACKFYPAGWKRHFGRQ
jgi:signal transduction histidine kinase